MENFDQIELNILNKIKNIKDRNSYESTKSEIFGKKGIITELFKKIGNLDQEKRKEYASGLNSLKIKITEIFTSYPTLNVLLEDIRGTVVFDVLENTPSDNRIKNILTTHKSMGELQNIGLRVSERRSISLTRAELSRSVQNSSSFIALPRLTNILRNTNRTTFNYSSRDYLRLEPLNTSYEGELDERDIELVMTHSRVNREEATSALTDANGDIVNAIMSFT